MVKKNIGMRGFTLVELMVVVAIIAILTGVVLANLNTSKGKARDAKRITDVESVRLALELYRDRCGEYPSASNQAPYLDVNADNGCPGNITLGTFLNQNQIPSYPAGTGETHYWYITPDGANPSEFALGAVLEHKTAALSDDLDGCAGDPDDAPVCSQGQGGWRGFQDGTFNAGDGPPAAGSTKIVYAVYGNN